MVNEPQADKSENEIGHTDADRLKQCSLCPQTSHLENARGKVKNSIDSRHLIEECNEKGEHDRNAKLPCPEMARGNLFGRGGYNRVCFSFNFEFGSIWLDELKDFHAGLAVIPFAKQPAGAFRKPDTEDGIKERWERCHAKHPAPGILTNSSKQGIRQESDEDAEHN